MTATPTLDPEFYSDFTLALSTTTEPEQVVALLKQVPQAAQKGLQSFLTAAVKHNNTFSYLPEKIPEGLDEDRLAMGPTLRRFGEWVEMAGKADVTPGQRRQLTQELDVLLAMAPPPLAQAMYLASSGLSWASRKVACKLLKLEDPEGDADGADMALACVQAASSYLMESDDPGLQESWAALQHLQGRLLSHLHKAGV